MYSLERQRGRKDKIEVKRHGWSMRRSNIILIRIPKGRNRKNEEMQYSKK